MKQEAARVIGLRARNIKSLRLLELTNVGDVTEIRGAPGNGKTAGLDAIRGGLEGLDPSMVRNGETAAEIELVLTTAKINRIIPADGSGEKLMVSDGAGNAFDKKDARDFLRTIAGHGTFDPLDWVLMSGGPVRGKTERTRQQRDVLLAAIPMTVTADEVRKRVRHIGKTAAEAMNDVDLGDVDFDQHALVVCEAIRSAVYDRRTDQNAIAKAAEATLANTPAPDRAAPEKSRDECQAAVEIARREYYAGEERQRTRSSTIERAERLRDAVAKGKAAELPSVGDARQAVNAAEAESIRMNAQVEELRELLRDAESAATKARNEAGAAVATLANVERYEATVADLAAVEADLEGDDVVDLTASKQLLAEAEGDLRARELQDRHDTAAATALSVFEKRDALTALVELFRDELPRDLIGRAPLPGDGLAVEGERLVVNGVPVHQLGTAEAIDLGVAVAAAVNPRSGFVLVDRAESLGREQRLALYESAARRGLQLILSFVDDDAKPGPGVVVMKDGEQVSAA